MPWAFCTTSTAMVSGMTSSMRACHENTGSVEMGAGEHEEFPAAGWNSRSATTMTAPAGSWRRWGGGRRGEEGY